MDSRRSRRIDKERRGASQGPTLHLTGGLRWFLAPRRQSSGTYRSGERRFRRVGDVTRSEILFTNGLGRDTRAAHLSLVLAGSESGPCVGGGELLLPN